MADLHHGESISFRSTSGPTPFVYTYELEPAAEGTRLRLDGTISTEGLGGWRALAARPWLRHGMSANLDALRHLVESERRGTN